VNTGIGFSEVGLILVIVLVFFGSKEIPEFIRVIAKFMAKIRHYTDKVKRELDSVTQMTEFHINSDVSEPKFDVADRKRALREQYLLICKELNDEIRIEKSSLIFECLKNTTSFKEASTVMMYLNSGSEVETKLAVKEMLKSGKRVILPYHKENGEMDITEIYDFEKDIVVGTDIAHEPGPLLRKQFFKSDLQLIVCPGVVFDMQGGRIGRGKFHYEMFLRELKGRIPIIGLAFDCQVCQGPLPFDYNDIAMDRIITESGTKMSIEKV
jgi:5-formyltetrahydrofolate cyclo-ligase